MDCTGLEGHYGGHSGLPSDPHGHRFMIILCQCLVSLCDSQLQFVDLSRCFQFSVLVNQFSGFSPSIRFPLHLIPCLVSSFLAWFVLWGYAMIALGSSHPNSHVCRSGFLFFSQYQTLIPQDLFTIFTHAAFLCVGAQSHEFICVVT